MCPSDIDKTMIFYRRLFGDILITRDSTPPGICGSDSQFAFTHPCSLREELAIPAAIVSAPRRKAALLLKQLVGKVDVRFAAQQIAQV